MTGEGGGSVGADVGQGVGRGHGCGRGGFSLWLTLLSVAAHNVMMAMPMSNNKTPTAITATFHPSVLRPILANTLPPHKDVAVLDDIYRSITKPVLWTNHDAAHWTFSVIFVNDVRLAHLPEINEILEIAAVHGPDVPTSGVSGVLGEMSFHVRRRGRIVITPAPLGVIAVLPVDRGGERGHLGRRRGWYKGVRGRRQWIPRRWRGR